MQKHQLTEQERQQAQAQLAAMFAPAGDEKTIRQLQQDYERAGGGDPTTNPATRHLYPGQQAAIDQAIKAGDLVPGLETRINTAIADAPGLKAAWEKTSDGVEIVPGGAKVNPVTGHNFTPQQIKAMQDFARAYKKKHKRASVREVTRATQKHFKIEIVK